MKVFWRKSDYNPRIIGQFRARPFMKSCFQCEQESWWYSCLQFYEFSAVDYIVFTIMLAVSASVGVSLLVKFTTRFIFQTNALLQICFKQFYHWIPKVSKVTQLLGKFPFLQSCSNIVLKYANLNYLNSKLYIGRFIWNNNEKYKIIYFLNLIWNAFSWKIFFRVVEVLKICPLAPPRR